MTKSDIAVCPESSSPSLAGQPIIPNLANPLLPTPLETVAPSSTSSTHCPQGPTSEPCLDQEEANTVGGSQVEERVEDQQTVLEETNRPRDPSKAPEHLRHHATLSLFSGMELVNRGKPVCLVEPVPVEPESHSGAEGYTDLAVEKELEKIAGSSSSTNSEPLQHSGEPVSAFSFLNL